MGLAQELHHGSYQDQKRNVYCFINILQAKFFLRNFILLVYFHGNFRIKLLESQKW